jgi:hypothetical protein
MATSKNTKERASSDDVFEFAPGWMPEDGERLIGTVADRGIGEGEFGKYIVITLRPDADQEIHVSEEKTRMPYTTTGDEDDLVAVHCFGAVLDNAIRSIRPAVGARLGFRKVGKRTRKGGDPDVARDQFNAWQVRDLSPKTEDDIFGKAEKHDDFGDDPDF